MIKEFLEIGQVGATHGVRGEVKVYPTTDDMRRFKRLKEVILDTGKEQMTLAKIDFEKYTTMSEEERKSYAEGWLYIHKKNSPQAVLK